MANKYILVSILNENDKINSSTVKEFTRKNVPTEYLKTGMDIPVSVATSNLVNRLYVKALENPPVSSTPSGSSALSKDIPYFKLADKICLARMN